MRVLIVEPNHLGHYYNNDRLVIDAVRALGAKVTLAVTPAGRASEEFAVHLEHDLADVEIMPILRPGRGGIIKGIHDASFNLNLAVRQARPDVVYVVTADGIAQASGLARLAGMSSIPRSVHCECLINRLTFTYPPSAARLAKRQQFPLRPGAATLSLLALKNSPFARIHLIDALAYEWIQQNDKKLASRVRMIPDPVEDFLAMSRRQAREALGIPADGRYIVCPGLLDGRKGIPQLIAAFAAAGLDNSDRLLLTGRVMPEIAADLVTPQAVELRRLGRLRIIDRVMSKADFAASLLAADVVACAYPFQPHPASIALKALACGRPVLAADSGWLGVVAPKFNMGWCVNVNDPDAFREIVPRSLNESSAWRLSDPARQLMEYSSADNYQRHWTAGLRALMGLPVSEFLKDWEWVTASMLIQ